ncbi:MAG: DUF1176 domain-containing protein, partial [Sphingomonadales bacterium]|nr:DUF1176 domain-containing protein [Sphingomonadales bacterium]
IPAPPAIPTYRVPPPAGEAQAAPLPAAEAMALHLAHDCDGIDEELLRNVAHPLAGGGDLILISCSRGAYNFSDIAFVRRGGELTPARFDRVFSWGDAGEIPLLVNSYWADGELGTYAKGRGIGDCGTAERFAWDGAMFRLIERREMNECRGSPHWITVWRAEAVVGNGSNHKNR